ncbi:MAG: VCBS repeat-containing protein, partial [Candidatus Methylomirabilis sp.]|nr:VCBS repeat-containing protein [Deltaproteobacteria bacterium]
MRLAALAAFAAASFWTAESHAQPILRYAFEGAIMNTQLGVAVAAGDVNGDGTRDFILATVVGPRVQVYSGTTGAWLREWLALGEITFGRKLASADFDGDGADDVVVASDRLNVVHVFSGATGALLFDAPGEAEGSGYGEALAAGDVNHDGMADLLVGAPAADGAAGADSGKVYVFGGPTGAPLYT